MDIHQVKIGKGKKKVEKPGVRFPDGLFLSVFLLRET